MSTMRDLVNQVRVNTSQGLTDPFNVLDAPYAPGQGTLTFKYPSDTILPGMILCSGLTTWQVLTTAPLARQVEVWASPNGELDLPLPVGSMLRIRPRYTDAAILSLLNAQIRLMSSMGHGLFGVLEWDDKGTGHGSYVVPPMTAKRITDIAAIYAGSHDARRARQLSGYSLQKINGSLVVTVTDEHGATIGTQLHFVGKHGFIAAERLEDDPIANCGLTDSMLDIPVLGASAHLMWGGESRRHQQSSQGDTRRPEETPATSGTSIAREWMRTRDVRIQEEYARLMAVYPPVRGRW